MQTYCLDKAIPRAGLSVRGMIICLFCCRYPVGATPKIQVLPEMRRDFAAALPPLNSRKLRELRLCER